MRFPKQFTIVLTLVVLAIGITVWLLAARIQKEVTSAHLDWNAENASFSVIGLIAQESSECKRIVVFCQWDKPPSPWGRFRFDFPGSEVDYGRGRYTAGTSALRGGRFVIHYFFRDFPPFLKRLDIPIHCWDSVTQRDIGLRLLSLRYWPYHFQGYGQFYESHGSQQGGRLNAPSAGAPGA
jgi:hypothetical protein